MKETIDEFFEEDSEITAMELVLTVLCAFLTGLVLGMLISPRKHTYIGSNNNSNNINELDDEIWEEDEILED